MVPLSKPSTGAQMNALDILSGIGTVLDTPRAMAWQIPVWMAGKGTDPLTAAFDPAQRTSGEDLLNALGMGEGLGRTAGGMGLEMLLDPMNILPGYALLKRLGKISDTKAFNQTALKLLESGGMPEELARSTKLSAPRFVPAEETINRLVKHAQTGSDVPAWIKQQPPTDLREKVVHDLLMIHDDRMNGLMQNEWIRGAGLPNEALTAGEYVSEPMRLLHGTGAPPFEKFVTDPGTGNWQGAGTYFTTSPEAADLYTVDKSGVFDRSRSSTRARELAGVVRDYFRENYPALEAAGDARSLESIALSRGPRYEYPSQLATDLQRYLGAKREHLLRTRQGRYEDLLANVRRNGHGGDGVPSLNVPTLSEARAAELLQINESGGRLYKSPKFQDAVHAATTRPRYEMRYGYSAKPFVYESAAEPELLNSLRSILNNKLPQAEHIQTPVVSIMDALESGKITNIQARQIAESLGISSDQFTDILRSHGYDSLSHGRMADSGFNKNLPYFSLDEHPETVIFDPQNIYNPWIAPTPRDVPSLLDPALLGSVVAQGALRPFRQAGYFSDPAQQFTGLEQLAN